MARLPHPDYHRQPSDSEWLVQVVQFHGHLGPAVVAGARMGVAGLRAVEAKGYFDVEVTCEGPLAKPPQACFLDGVQVATGATLGKRTLQWVQADQIAANAGGRPGGNDRRFLPSSQCPLPVDLVRPIEFGQQHGVQESAARVAPSYNQAPSSQPINTTTIEDERGEFPWMQRVLQRVSAGGVS
jgi:hypothetical protein